MEFPLLLGAPTNYARDAARAAGRFGCDMRHRVTDRTLTDLLGLPGMIVTEYVIEVQGSEKILHIYCEHEHEVALCPRCQQVSTILHDSEERCVRHLDIWGTTTFLHFAGRRFDCEGCGKPFTEQLSWIEKNRRQTEGFELCIYQRCKKEDQSTVAREERLHPITVNEIFKRWAKRATRNRGQPRIRVLGIDEISLKKRHKQFVLVLSDLERRCVIEILPDRSKKSLETWLDSLAFEKKRAIESVSMDMWEPYRQAIKAQLPHAKIVADRFHIMKQLNERLTKLRRSIQAQADPEVKESLKGSRWLLVKNRVELNAIEEEKLANVLEASPELRELYLLKEEFRSICEKISDRPRAARFIETWICKAEHADNKHMNKFVGTLRNWGDEFLNYFDAGVTNGFVEGLNHAIRNIIHRAFGYHSFDNFRLQVLVEHGDLALPH